MGVISIEDRLEELKSFYEYLIDNSNITEDFPKEELLPYLELEILNCICDVVMMTKQTKSVKIKMMNEAVALVGIDSGIIPEQYLEEIANDTELGQFYKIMFSAGSPIGSFWMLLVTMGRLVDTSSISDKPIGIVNGIFAILIQVENYLTEKYEFLGKERIAQEYMVGITRRIADKCYEEE